MQSDDVYRQSAERFMRFYNKIERNISMEELLQLFFEFGIDYNRVSFVPIFSLVNNNHLIRHVYCEQACVKVQVHVSKVTVLAPLIDYYHRAYMHDQVNMQNAIIIGSARVLHSYFYHLCPELNQFSSVRFYADDVVYSKYDTVVDTISHLIDSLQYSLSCYNPVMELQQCQQQFEVDDYVLGKNTVLRNFHLNGGIAQKVLQIMVRITVPQVTDEQMEKIQQLITSDPIYKSMKYKVLMTVSLRAHRQLQPLALPFALSCSLDNNCLENVKADDCKSFALIG